MTEVPAAPSDIFPPTLREVLLRPRWLAMLAFCLVVAGVFAWLGQWQLGRAINTSPAPPGATEQARPLGDIVTPGAYISDPSIGQRVEVAGDWVPGDFLIVSSRYNDGAEGFWVTGQLRVDPTTAGTDGPTSLAVALGWAPTRAEAEAAVARLDAETPVRTTISGRLISDEGPEAPPADVSPQELVRMSPAMLLGRWHDVDGLDVYRGYVTAAQPVAGLVAISSPPPTERGNVNWLNIFYAVEWAVFAGFAFYLWYRLAKDAWEKELEELEEGSD